MSGYFFIKSSQFSSNNTKINLCIYVMSIKTYNEIKAWTCIVVMDNITVNSHQTGLTHSPTINLFMNL